MGLLHERVVKRGSRCLHPGTVVAEFTTTDGESHVVVEFIYHMEKMLNIYRPDQVRVIDTEADND